MASTISAGTTSATAMVYTADTSGVLQLASNNGTTAITVDTSQNVGIGTTGPLSTQSNRIYLSLKGTGTAAGTGLGVLQFQTNAAGSTGPNMGNIEWDLPDNSGSTSLRCSYISSSVEGSTANNRGSNMSFATKPDGVSSAGAEAMRIDSSQNVGIGTTSPNGIRLNVDSAALNTSTAYIKNNGALPDNNDNSALYVNHAGTAGTGFRVRTDQALTGTNFAHILINNASASINGLQVSQYGTGWIANFDKSGTSAFFIGNNSKVGIGTTSPGANLEVKGASGQNIYVSYTSGSQLRLKSDSGDSGVGTTGSTPLLFLINNGEVGRFDTSGNLGIGTSALSGYKLCVGNTSSVTTLNGVGLTLFTSGSLTSNIGGVLNFRPGLGQTASDIFNLSICAYDHSGDTNTDGLSINGYDGISFCTGSNARNERMRISGNGDIVIMNALTGGTGALFVGRQTTIANGRIEATGNDNIMVTNQTDTGSGAKNILYILRNTNYVGGITCTNTTTSFPTSSDYRLKQDIAPMTGALNKVAALKPVTYRWKLDGSDGEGFIAHELAEVCPHAVTGAKDAVDEDGNPKYQGIDVSFLVATLTAAIQELKAEFDAYKASHP